MQNVHMNNHFRSNPSILYVAYLLTLVIVIVEKDMQLDLQDGKQIISLLSSIESHLRDIKHLSFHGVGIDSFNALRLHWMTMTGR